MSFGKRPKSADEWVAEAPLRSANEEQPWVGLDPNAPTAHRDRSDRCIVTTLIGMVTTIGAKRRFGQSEAGLSILLPA